MSQPVSKTRVLCRRTKQIISLVHTKNNLLSQLELACSEVEYNSILSLLHCTRTKLRKLRKAENHFKRISAKRSLEKAFKKNPYKCGKDILSPPSTTYLKISNKKLDEYLSESVSDNSRNIELGDLTDLPEPPFIKHKFKNSILNDKTFYNVLSRRSNSSTPGPNAIPYKVYKKCQHLSRFLLLLIKGFFKKGVVPLQWRIAKTVFIPKVPNPDPSNMKDFRSISLMNSEGKIF